MPTAQNIAFVCPRFSDGPMIGGAEALLRALAERTARAGRQVTFLATCARDHVTWANDAPPGSRRVGEMDVALFPVDEDRDTDTFFRVQDRISRRVPVTEEEEQQWLLNSVNSSALCEHLRDHASQYDRIVAGPYLYSLIYQACRIAPEKTLLVPCLHDEPFAYLRFCKALFSEVRGLIFNSRPEQDLARRLYGPFRGQSDVVGMGLEPFDVDSGAFAKRAGLTVPYVIYSGRREPLKGTPLLLEYVAVFRERTAIDVKLVLTGSGPVSPPPGLSKHVVDCGFLPTKEKQEAMAGAVAFCHPSLNESLSIVLLEAWLAGTPALVHAGSAVLRHQCSRSGGGLWFRFYPEFEEALLRLLEDKNTRTTLGRQGRDYVLKEYSWPAVEGRLLAALDR